MLKAILYIVLSIVGISATFITPFAGVISCIEAYLMNPSALAMPDGGYRYQLFASLALLASLLMHWQPPVAEVGREKWLLRMLWTFIAVAASSALWAEVNPSMAIESVYELFKTVLLVAVMVRLIRTERQMAAVVTAMIIGAWHAGFMHVLGIRLGWVPTSLAKDIGVLSDPQTGVMILFVPLVILMAIFGTKLQRILSWLAIPFVLDSIVGTYERTGVVAIAFECALILLYLPRRIVFRLLPALAVAGGLFFFRFTPADYWEKMATVLNPHEEASANSRFVINRASVQMFMDHPLGVGYRNYMYVSPRYLGNELLTDVGGERLRSPHNSYFEILCDTGIEGFVVWIAVFIGAVLVLRSVRRRENSGNITPLQAYAIAFEIGLFGWAIGGWTQDYQEVDPAYWFVGFAVVLIRLRRQAAASADLSEEAVDDNAVAVSVAAK